MLKHRSIVFAAAVMGLLGACGKKESSGGPGPGAESAPIAAPVVVSSHFGIADRVPQDVDLFLAGYHADELIAGTLKKWLGKELLHSGTDAESTGQTEDPLERISSYTGDEMFAFVGPGAAGKLGMLGATYQNMSAAWSGMVMATTLNLMASDAEGLKFDELSESLTMDLVDGWLKTLESDSQLQIPSIVVGWRPHADKQTECRDAVITGLEQLMVSKPDATAVAFESSGVALSGFEITGRQAFGEEIAKARESLAARPDADKVLSQITPERLERLLAALENVRFTLAAGMTDGRILIYLGNGSEGFQLADTPAQSLAASPELSWTAGHASAPIHGLAYLSDATVRAALPWLDGSVSWKTLAATVRPPIREQRLFQSLLAGLGETDGKLAMRTASAYSAVLLSDQGWRIESQGGWPDPTLDYTAPLTFVNAATAQSPAIRAHWVQHRGRNDLEWLRLEYFGALAAAVHGELVAAENPLLAMLPADAVSSAFAELRAINRAYRDEFRAGVGDEVALIVDFEGEVPPIPGISQATVEEARAPRFVLARPVVNRAMLTAAGKSHTTSWRNLTQLASDQSGTNLPLILPQSIESGGLTTWYPPLPFIGGDFVPGVTLNDDLWMLGTSRSMATGFSNSMATSSPTAETGMLIEVEFAPIRTWLADFYRRYEAEAKELAGSTPDEMKDLTQQANLDRIATATRSLESLRYRKWLADGKPRSSLHLRLSPAE